MLVLCSKQYAIEDSNSQNRVIWTTEQEHNVIKNVRTRPVQGAPASLGKPNRSGRSPILEEGPNPSKIDLPKGYEGPSSGFEDPPETQGGQEAEILEVSEVSSSDQPATEEREQSGQEDLPEKDVDVEEPARLVVSDRPKASVSKPSVFTFPAPPTKNINNPEDFFRYWSKLRPEELVRARIYVYRLWPTTDPTQTLTTEQMKEIEERRARAPERYCDLPDPTKPFSIQQWKQEVLHRYGSGDYNLKLNDTHPKINTTICQTWIYGLRDLSTYPPVVDIDQLVLTDPVNQSYIRWRQTNNLPMPKGVDNQEDPDSMSTAVVKELLEQNKEQSAKIVELSSKAATPAEPVDPNARAERTAIDTMADATRASTKLVADSYTKAQEATAKAQDPVAYFDRVMETVEKVQEKLGVGKAAATAAPSFDPMAMLEKTLDVVAKLQAPSAAAQNALIEQLKEEAKSTRAMLTELLKKPSSDAAAAAAATTDPRRPKSMLEQIKEAQEVVELLGGKDEGSSTAGLPKWLPFVIAGGSSIFSSIANAIYNAKLQAGQQPATPPPMPAELTEGVPGAEGGQAAAGPQSTQSTQPEDPMTGIKNLLDELREPLLSALNQGSNGTQFAANFIGYKGAMTYDFLCSQGKQALIQFLQMDPLLWQEVIKIPVQFEKFLDQFLDSARAHNLAKAFRNAQVRPKNPASAPAQASAPASASSPTNGPTPIHAMGPRVVVDPVSGKSMEVMPPDGPFPPPVA